MHNLSHLKVEVLEIPPYLLISSLKAVKPDIESLALIPIERTLMSPIGGWPIENKLAVEVKLKVRQCLT
jgi:hypothetical protein